jgi:hypothetical protein
LWEGKKYVWKALRVMTCALFFFFSNEIEECNTAHNFLCSSRKTAKPRENKGMDCKNYLLNDSTHSLCKAHACRHGIDVDGKSQTRMMSSSWAVEQGCQGRLNFLYVTVRS